MNVQYQKFIDDLLEDLEGAFAENTLRAYQSDFTHFCEWCEEQEVEAIPPTPEVLASYVEAMAKDYKSATIRRYLNSLGSICFFADFGKPTHSPKVKLALKKMHRKIGRHQSQAQPLTREYLDKMLKKCDRSIAGMRNRLLLLIGYETMRRRAEICAFKLENLQMLPSGEYALLLERSKTDQLGEGRLIPISDELGELIIRWAKRTGLKSGPILRGVRKGGHLGGPLAASSVTNILIDLQYRARLRHIRHFSGHSFRVGAALDMLNAGVPLEKIMLRGGWRKETTALRYLQSWVGSVNPGQLNAEGAHPNPLIC